MKRLRPRARFLLLHAGTLVIGFGLPPILPAFALLVWGPAIGLLGLVAASIAIARCERNGISALRFLVTGAVSLLGFVCFWGISLVFLYGLLSLFFRPDDRLCFAGLQWTQLPVFSTGCLAYFGLGPFRPRVTPMQRARRLLANHPALGIGGAARPEQVEQAERLLGLRLPRSYREFLLAYGEFRSPAIRFLGFGPSTDLDHPTVEDCVGATFEGRESFGLPASYLMCSVDADGQVVCLDAFAMRDEEGLAILWNCEARSIDRVVASSFGEYLAERLATVAAPARH